MDDKDGKCGMDCQNLAWWATLVIAVLAIPAVGVIVAVMLGLKDMMAIAGFMITCWVCTYLGMRLMHNPKMAQKLDIDKK